MTEEQMAKQIVFYTKILEGANQNNMAQTAVDYTNLDLDTMYNKYKNHSPHKLANDEMFKTEEGSYMYFTKEQFIDNIKTNDRFLNKWL